MKEYNLTQAREIILNKTNYSISDRHLIRHIHNGRLIAHKIGNSLNSPYILKEKDLEDFIIYFKTKKKRKSSKK